MTEMSKLLRLFPDLVKVELEHNTMCQQCSLYRLRLPLGLHSNDLARLIKVVNRS